MWPWATDGSCSWPLSQCPSSQFQVPGSAGPGSGGFCAAPAWGQLLLVAISLTLQGDHGAGGNEGCGPGWPFWGLWLAWDAHWPKDRDICPCQCGCHLPCLVPEPRSLSLPLDCDNTRTGPWMSTSGSGPSCLCWQEKAVPVPRGTRPSWGLGGGCLQQHGTAGLTQPPPCSSPCHGWAPSPAKPSSCRHDLTGS